MSKRYCTKCTLCIVESTVDGTGQQQCSMLQMVAFFLSFFLFFFLFFLLFFGCSVLQMVADRQPHAPLTILHCTTWIFMLQTQFLKSNSQDSVQVGCSIIWSSLLATILKCRSGLHLQCFGLHLISPFA